MSPPPSTPSPNRFITRKQAPNRQISLAQGATVRSQIPRQENPGLSRPSTQQFNATPRFSFSSTPRNTQDVPTFTPASSRYVTPARRTTQRSDLVEPSSDELDDEQQSSGFWPQYEENGGGKDGAAHEDDDDDKAEPERPPSKRRRISLSFSSDDDNEHQRPASSSTLLALPSSTVLRNIPTPRFKSLTQVSPANPRDGAKGQPNFTQAPRFRPPDPSSSRPNVDPLPEQFSPHRRGQKYIAGGLASEVRGWLMNISAAISGNEMQRKTDDLWTIKILVEEVSGGPRIGMTLIKGKQVHVHVESTSKTDSSQTLKFALTGESAGTGLDKQSNVVVASVVGIRGPMWQISIGEDDWRVGCGWQVLQS